MEDPLFPIAVLMDELRSDDTQQRLNAIRRLDTISLALGPERTRTELVAFLDDSIDDEDEVLLALAEELNKLVDSVGGDKHAHVLLAPLENLAGTEEVLVREKAVQSIASICQHLSLQQIEASYLPLLKRLSSGEWFTSRTSACGLYTAVYPKCGSSPETQTELRRMFGQLATDDTPMVRRSAANAFPGFVRVVQDGLSTDLVPVLIKLATDDQDSVRLLAVDVLIAVAEVVKESGGRADSDPRLVGAMRGMVQDKSWRVRYMVADHFNQLASAVGDDIVRQDLVAAFTHLLKDTEAEVRTASAAQIAKFCKLLKMDVVLSRIIPLVRDLVMDQSQHVRASLGMHISDLAPIMGRDLTDEHLLPLFLQLLKDDFPDVRLNLISRLDIVNDVIGIDRLTQSLLPAIIELAEDKQWRVRLAIIEYVPLLAQQLGVRFFNDELSSLCMSWLGDTVFSIREAATINLRKLVETFGVEWARDSILTHVLGLAEHSNYLYRMTTIFALTAMTPVLDLASIRQHVLPCLDHLQADSIPNIRFNTAKAFEVIVNAVRNGADNRNAFEGSASGSAMGIDYGGENLDAMLIDASATDLGVGVGPGVGNSTIEGVPGPTAGASISGTPASKVGKFLGKIKGGSSWTRDDAELFIRDQIRPRLEQLIKDTDPDVVFFAHQALRIC